MKKEWKQPKLEVLDVSKTMGGLLGSQFDATYNSDSLLFYTPSGS